MAVDYPNDALAVDDSVSIGDRVRIRAGELVIGAGVHIGAGTVLAGDSLTLDDGVQIGPDCDLRASELVIGRNTEIADVQALVADRFELGPAGRVSRGSEITCRSFQAGRLFYAGDQLLVGAGGTQESSATVTIGDRVALGPHNILNANLPIVLGEQVGSGSYVTFWTHGYHFGHRVLDGFAAVFEGVSIEENVWLGFHVTVLPGVRVGANTIVASGSIVARDLPADCLAAGVPAQPKRALHPRPLIGAEADRLIEELLEGWRHEMEWKGWKTERVPGPALILEIFGPTERSRARVIFLRADSPVDGLQDAIVLSVEERPGVNAGTLFELRSGRMSGAASTVAEDLRDYLRRRTLPCGDDTCFRAIEPIGFARLKHMMEG